jgi:hypothetical protein
VYAACGVPIKNSEVDEYIQDEQFLSALEAWIMTRKYGLANGSVGWANEPSEYIDAVFTLESEQSTIEAEEMDKKTKASKANAPKSYKGRR